MRQVTRGRWIRRWFVALDVLAVLLVGGYFLADLRLDRIDAVADHRLRPTDGPGRDWLLVRSERRTAGRGGAPTGTDGRRIDTLLLLHIPHAAGRPTLIRLPRTTYAPVEGHGRTTFEAAYALGGPPLLVATIESGIGVRVDRYLESATPVEALVERVARPGVLLDPLRGVPTLVDTTRSITVDEADHVHHLIQLATALHRAGGGDAVTTTLPIGQYTSIAGVGPVALIDDARIRLLAVAIAADRPLPASLLTG